MPVFNDAVPAAAPAAAGIYINLADLVARYGEQNIITWSNQSGGSATTVNVTRVQGAIDFAESHLHDLFRGRRYRIPFPATQPTVKDWCLRLAAWDLATMRGVNEDSPVGDKLSELRADVEREVSRVIMGVRKLDAPFAGAEPTAPWVE